MKSILPVTLAILTAVVLAAAVFLESGDEAAARRSLPASDVVLTPSSSSTDFPSLKPERTPVSPTVAAIPNAGSRPDRVARPDGSKIPASASSNPPTLKPAITGMPQRAMTGGEPVALKSDATDAAAVNLREPNSFPAALSQVPPALGALSLASEFVVPRGAVLPAAFLDPAEGASPAQVEALERVADDFLADLSTVDAPTVVKPAQKQTARRTQPSRWDAATRQADERYRQLFGVEAYNARTAAAAKDALAEK